MLEAVVAEFEIDANAFADFAPRTRPLGPEPDLFTPAQETTMLAGLLRTAEGQFRKEAARIRVLKLTEELDPDYDPIAAAIAAEIAISHVYRLIAVHGRSARVDPSEEARLEAAGVSRENVRFVKDMVEAQARCERGTSWALGPSKRIFEEALRNVGLPLNDWHVVRLRRSYLEACAALLLQAEARYQAMKPDVAAALSEMRTSPVPPALQPVQAGNAAPCSLVTVREEPVVLTGVAPREAHLKKAHAVIARRTPKAPEILVDLSSFTSITHAFAATKLTAGDFNEKTVSQHQSLARLFLKVTETDDTSKITQQDIDRLGDLLRLLPKAWGKSPRDQKATVEDILVRAEDLDDDELGLEAGTIQRYATQLDGILNFARSRGVDLGRTGETFKVKGTHKPRSPFSIQDRIDLYSAPVWTGFSSIDERGNPGTEIVHDALYFVPLLGGETMMRLSEATGLMVADVSLRERLIYVRPNAERTVKTLSAVRELPITEELERLGFCDYAEAVKKCGYKLLFPELRLRGARTPLSNLFYKDWLPVLRAALPGSEENNQSFHSFRKTGNSELLGKIEAAMRLQIMGHAPTDTNSKHYVQLPIEDKRQGLSFRPKVTAHILRAPIKLHPDLDCNRRA